MGKRVKKGAAPFFWVGAAIYAAAAFLLIGIGLNYFWDFLAAYEDSRPKNTVNSYMESLTAEHIRDVVLPGLLAQTDTRVQAEEECRERILETLQGEITAAKNVSRSTGEKQVYALRQGGRVIGSFQIEQEGEATWGFTPWAVTGEEFDLSFLMTGGMEVTVPSNYTVYVNEKPLTCDCVAESGIPYTELAEFADGYDLPTMVRYKAGPFLGEARVTLTDGEGNAADLSAGTLDFLNNCSPEEQEALDAATRAFIQVYVDFSSCNGGSPSTTLRRLNQLMIPDGALAKRMRNALDGLYWVSDRHASVIALEIALISRISDGLYVCDVTYTVDTRDLAGQVQVESHVKLLFRQTDAALLAEAMENC